MKKYKLMLKDKVIAEIQSFTPDTLPRPHRIIETVHFLLQALLEREGMLDCMISVEGRESGEISSIVLLKLLHDIGETLKPKDELK